MFNLNVNPGSWVGGPGEGGIANRSPALHTVGVLVENSSARDPANRPVLVGGKNVEVNSGVDENESLFEVFPEFAHGFEAV